jgi:hypothetical protein
LPVGISAQESQDSGGPDTVFTGIYLMNIYDLDINAYSFYADFYVWFRWKGERDPTNIEFVNAVEKWGFTQIMFHEEEPKVLPDGYFYNGLRIEGRFYYSFILNRFPMDRHGLEIRIENVDYLLDSLVYLPDTSTHLMREDFIIPGWKIDGTKMQAHANFYQTNFGEPVEGGASPLFQFHIHPLYRAPAELFFTQIDAPPLGGHPGEPRRLVYPSHIYRRSNFPTHRWAIELRISTAILQFSPSRYRVHGAYGSHLYRVVHADCCNHAQDNHRRQQNGVGGRGNHSAFAPHGPAAVFPVFLIFCDGCRPVNIKYLTNWKIIFYEKSNTFWGLFLTIFGHNICASFQGA